MVRTHRSPSVMKAAEVAQIPHVPVILFIGGPGGGKTRHAARIANTFADQGLAHICMPDVIRNALLKYKERYSEWKAANDCYLRGELIPNHLALALVKAEMGRHPQASAFLLEGFPREARQVEDFEKQVKSVNMALILDYDEKTLRDHMEKRGVNLEIIDQRIKEFKQKTLPSAKYFDDHHLLHLIPGEKDDQTIYERTKDLVQKAMSSGVPILNNSPVNQPQFHACDAVTREDNRVAATKSSGEEEIRTSQKRSCSNRVQLDSRTEIEPNTDTMTDSLRSNFPVEESVLVTKSPYDSAEPFNATISEPAPKFPKSEADARRTSLDAANVSIKSVPVVLIIGAPGASRAEIAKRIVQKFYGFILLSMGDLLRSNIAAQVGDKLWRSVARQVERGEQVPLVAGLAPMTEVAQTDLLTTLCSSDNYICSEAFCISSTIV